MSDQRVKTSKAKLSIALISTLIISVSALISAMMLNLISMDRTFSQVKQEYFKMLELSGDIKNYDEILTSSARMAVITNEIKWKDRYDAVAPQLDNAINEALGMLPEKYKIKEAEETNSANAKMIEMETRAFDLLNNGNQKEAESVLFGKEYEQQKSIYSKGIVSYLDAMKNYADLSIIRHRKINVVLISIQVGILLATIALVCFFLSRYVKSIRQTIEGLIENADQVSAASGQVSSASQQLADGSSRQAESIEETSSSLEEIASMTQQNAENSFNTKSLMLEMSQIVDETNSAMEQLSDSMTEISRRSEETQKIIRAIDEIAFQTNLLSLNASVEAARAGEAGAGFAVVADEVRNLSIRASDAAKNTAALIEGSVNEIRDGSSILSKTCTNFNRVSKAAKKISDLIAEIATASQEQAQGVEQINVAVNEIGIVTHQNAANSQESAAASEEMNAQAEMMRFFVKDLAALVGRTKYKAFPNQIGLDRQQNQIACR
ncbi:MAG: methyl-accepting chemotaxis protein [Desulfobacterales bacterium]|nr:methyl-accepting chemotaxis protein [Desulfobacterales bacterium]MDD4073180.1 methyl-accepting chemotaxis protein [Desulfobacterales bacterium]MDD4393635.1 methyl-accepting chemotaxis protein [Desulfobacterales bacterium]